MDIDFAHSGRMIGPSKTGYLSAHPDSKVVFNANVLTESEGKIWWGDLDLTLDANDLRALASARGETVYVFYESDAREAGAAPPWSEAVARFAPTDAAA